MKDIKKRSECPVSYCLDFFGDKWTLLIMRDMVLNEKTTFGDFLKSEEGIATNILTDRLKALETEGFIIKHSIAGKARTGYYLTEKGISLIPLTIEMAYWGITQDVNGTDPKLSEQVKKNKGRVIEKLSLKWREKLNTINVQLES